MTNFIYSVGPLPPVLAPVVTPTNFTVPPNATADELVGTINFTGGTPTAWAIISGDPNHNFAIYLQGDGTAHLRTSAGTPAGGGGGPPPPAGNYSLTVQATNSGGFGNGVVGIVVQAQPVPVVSSFTGSITMPLTAGELIGTVSATNSPTSWAITAGNANGYFAIDNSGNLTVTAAGATGLTPGNYVLTVQATNSGGSGSNSATITVNAATSGATRNAFIQPFASNSIWNHPIGVGTGALISQGNGPHGGVQYTYSGGGGPVYEKITPAYAGPANYYNDENLHMWAPNGAATEVFANTVDWSGGQSARCAATQTDSGVTELVPPGTTYLDVYGSTPNACASNLQADRQTIRCNQPAVVCGVGGKYTTHYTSFSGTGLNNVYSNVNILTDGTAGAHGGSGLSSVGDTIRWFDIRPGNSPFVNGVQDVMRHALGVAMNSDVFGSAWAAKTWPATTSDGGHEGLLLALLPTFDHNSLSTPPGRSLAWTLKNYGAYITDNIGPSSTFNAIAFSGEYSYSTSAVNLPPGRTGVTFQSDWGYAFNAGASTASGFGADIATICQNLFVITNNSPTTIGGDTSNGTNLMQPFLPGPADPGIVTVVPGIAAQQFTISGGVTAGAVVGTVVASNWPYFWSLSGTNSNLFNIARDGTIRVAWGQTVPSGTYTLTATGTNIVGSGSGTITITATGAVGSVFPGQPGNPVGYAATPATAPANWPGGTWPGAYPGSLTTYTGSLTFNQVGTASNPVIIAFQDIDCGSNGLTISGSYIYFVGCRIQSNNLQSAASGGSGTNIGMFYCSITPRVALQPTIPNAAWPAASAGQNINITSSNFANYMIGPNNGYEYGCYITGGGPWTLEHCDIWGFGNAIVFVNATTAQMTVNACWMHDAANPSTQGYHTDGPGYLNGGTPPSNIAITNCTIASMGNTNGIAFQAATSGYNNINVSGNYLSGFNVLVDMCHNVAGSTNLTFKNNTIGTDLQWVNSILYADFTTMFTHASNPTNNWSGNKLNVVSGTTPSSQSSVSFTSANNGQFIWPNSTFNTTDFSG